MINQWRDIFYNAYSTNATSHEFEWTPREYKFFSKINRLRYSNILPSDKTAKILDIACGAGHFLYFLQNEAGFINAEGIDISKEQVEKAHSAGLKNIFCGDLNSYLLEHENQYDIIIMQHFIEHLTKIEIMNLLILIKSSLKIGGKVIITTGNVASLFGASHVYSDFTHEGGFTPRSLSQLLKTMGFNNVNITGLTPLCYDAKSRIRFCLWAILKKLILFYMDVERGSGRLHSIDRSVIEYEILGIGER